MTTRIIAKLDAKPTYVVKPVHFKGLRKVGKLDELAKKYYDQGADELFYLDIGQYLDKKVKIMNVYKDEMDMHPFPRSEKNMGLDNFRGIKT